VINCPSISNITEQPRLPSANEIPALATFHGNPHRLARPFLLLCIVQLLMKRISPGSTWSSRLRNLLQVFPQLDHLDLNLVGMGVDDHWQARDW